MGGGGGGGGGGGTGFDVEDMLVDLYYWFDKSTKPKNQLSEFGDLL